MSETQVSYFESLMTTHPAPWWYFDALGDIVDRDGKYIHTCGPWLAEPIIFAINTAFSQSKLSAQAKDE